MGWTLTNQQHGSKWINWPTLPEGNVLKWKCGKCFCKRWFFLLCYTCAFRSCLTITIFVCNSRNNYSSWGMVITHLQKLMFDKSISKVNSVYVIKYKITIWLDCKVWYMAFSDQRRQEESSDGKHSVSII